MKKIFTFLVALSAFSFNAWAQIQVQGVVRDNAGQVMPGVTITIKGTTKGAYTDQQGEYAIQAPEGSTLQYSFVGYLSKELLAAKEVNVTLEPEDINLEEVVVVGYGSQRKENLTGAVETMSVKDLGSRPVTNLSSALQGLAAGVDVLQASGEPGGDDGVIRIRGISSIDNNNEPLVIVDGMESSINSVNAKDIESISVLKDAASSAIYGNRAAAGVILITTKSGSEGKLTVNASAMYGVQQATALPDYVGAVEWCNLSMEAMTYQGSLTDAVRSNRTILISQYEAGTRKPSNFLKEYVDIAPMQEYFVSASGGNKNFKGSFSGGYLDQDGILAHTSSQKYTFRTAVDGYTLNRKLNMRFNASGYRLDKEENPSEAIYVMNRVNSSNPTSIFIDANGLYGYNSQEPSRVAEQIPHSMQ